MYLDLKGKVVVIIGVVLGLGKVMVICFGKE